RRRLHSARAPCSRMRRDGPDVRGLPTVPPRLPDGSGITAQQAPRPRETTLGEIHSPTRLTSTSSVCGRTLIASLYQATERTCVCKRRQICRDASAAGSRPAPTQTLIDLHPSNRPHDALVGLCY